MIDLLKTMWFSLKAITLKSFVYYMTLFSNDDRYSEEASSHVCLTYQIFVNEPFHYWRIAIAQSVLHTHTSTPTHSVLSMARSILCKNGQWETDFTA